MEAIKRKISEEFDSSGSTELSDDVKQEIESSGDLKEFADDLIKVEGFLHALRDAKTVEPEWGSLVGEISKSLDEDGPGDASLLAAPLPDGSKDDVTMETKASDEKTPVKDEDLEAEGERIRMTAAKQPVPTKEEETSGVINIGALVEQHRKATSAGRGGLDLPPSFAGSGAVEAGRSGRTWLVALGVGAVVVIAVAVVAGITISKKNKEAAQATRGATVDRAALEEQIKQEILAQLRAEGKIGAEAEAEAQRKAQILAQAEIDRQATEEGEEIATTDEGKVVKKKKKREGHEEEAGAPSVSTEPKPSGAASKKEPGSKTATAPKTAGDDLAALLEGATAGKKKDEDLGKALSTKPAEQKPTEPTKGGTPAPSPTPTPTSTGGGILPKTLEKEAIRNSMNKIKPRVLKCGEGKIGTLMLALVVSNDGSVKSAKVTGKFATDPAGQCAEGVAMTAKFPPFQNPTASVTYPFVFAPKAGE